jgi:hypothetical protein
MRFIALVLFMAFGFAPAFAQGLDKSDYVTLSIGKITLEDVSEDVKAISVHCYTYTNSSDSISKSNMNDPKLWQRSGHADIANYTVGGDNRKKMVINSQKISMFRQDTAPIYANGDKSYACQLNFLSTGSQTSPAGGTPAWAQGSGNYFVKGDF